MSIDNEVRAALDAHAMWKSRLRNAIATSSCEFVVEDVAKDNVCQFGKWLYVGMSPALRDEHHERIRGLHAAFHEEAAAVLALALEGSTGEARMAMGPGSAFSRTSTALIAALQEWVRAEAA